MSAKEWADAIVQIVEAVAWPGALLVALWILRGHFPAIGRWFESTVKDRGFEATTPVGAIKVAPPDLSIRGDRAALAELARDSDDPETQKQIQAALMRATAAEQAVAEVREEVRASAAFNQPQSLARRIAEQARLLIEDDLPENFRWTEPFVWSLDMPHERAYAVALREHGDYALLLTAFYNIEGQENFPEADWETWTDAARMLRNDGIPTSDPPFSRRDLGRARKATGASMPPGWTRSPTSE